jgi:foldase protein PrsA
MWKWIPLAACALTLGAGAAVGDTPPAPSAAPANPGPAGTARGPQGATTTPAIAKPASAAPKRPVTLAILQKPSLTAATVNGEPISVGKLVMRLLAVGGPQILDRLTQEQIIRQEARKQRVVVSETDVKARLDQNFKEFLARFGTPARFQEYLDRQHLTRHAIMQAMRPNVEMTLYQEKLREKVTAKAQVTDKEINDQYQAQMIQYMEPETVKIRQILVTVSGTDPNEEQKAKAKAEEVLKKIQAANGSNFAEVAKELSDDQETKSKGGEMPPLRRPTFYGLTFDQAIFSASPGLVPQVVRSVRGWHIIMVDEKKPARSKPLEEVKETIKNQLLQQKRAELFRTYMEAAQKSARTDLKLEF